MNRFVIQEMNISGFTHYKIIDTENKCVTIYTSKDYAQIIEVLEQLNNNNYFYEPQNDKWYTKKELINIIKTINNCTNENAES